MNDCPARARVEGTAVEVRYAGGSARLGLDGAGVVDVALEPPPGATRVELQPLGIAFARSGAIERGLCPTGWEPDGRVLLRRLPVGRHEVTWSGPGMTSRSALDVEAEPRPDPPLP